MVGPITADQRGRRTRLRRTSSPAIWAAIAALLACVLAGPGSEAAWAPSDAPHNGPLSLGGDTGTICMPAAPSGQYTDGFDAVQNTTDASIQVTGIRLVGAQHATMHGGYLAPIINTTLIGALPGWPPTGGTLPTFSAKKAVPAQIAAGQSANLVIHLSATPPATVQAVEVTYISDGEAFRVRNSTTLIIQPKCM